MKLEQAPKARGFDSWTFSLHVTWYITISWKRKSEKWKLERGRRNAMKKKNKKRENSIITVL